MDVKLQILSFLISFIYGCFYYLSSKYNLKLIYGKNILFRILITIIFVLNNVLIYLILLYKINTGRFHIYFLISLILGYIFCSFVCKNVIKRMLSIDFYKIFR